MNKKEQEILRKRRMREKLIVNKLITRLPVDLPPDTLSSQQYLLNPITARGEHINMDMRKLFPDILNDYEGSSFFVVEKDRHIIYSIALKSNLQDDYDDKLIQKVIDRFLNVLQQHTQPIYIPDLYDRHAWSLISALFSAHSIPVRFLCDDYIKSPAAAVEYLKKKSPADKIKYCRHFYVEEMNLPSWQVTENEER